VRIGSGLAEAGAGDVDEPLVDGADRLIVEPVPLERADGEGLHEHVPGASEMAGPLLALGRGDVDRDRFLAAIAGEVVRTLARVPPLHERLEGPRLVPPLPLLAPDHLPPRAGAGVPTLARAPPPPERLEGPRLLPRLRLLDLDHLRPELGEDHRRERARE